MSKIKIIIIGCLFSIGLTAQNKLTLDEYRKHVADYNQQLKSAKASTVAAEAKRNIVRVGFLPKLDGAANYTFTNKIELFEPLELSQHNYSAQLKLTQPVYMGGALQSNYRAAKIEKEIAVFNEDYTLDQVLYNADLTYWAAVANRQFYENTIQYYQQVETLFNTIKARFEDGRISRTDLLQVQTRLKEAEQQRLQAKQAAEIATQNFYIMMGENVDNPVTPSESIEQINSIPKEMTLDETLAERPDYAIGQKQIDLAVQQTNAAVAKFNPQIAVGANGQWGTKSINIDGKTLLDGNVYVSLSVPIFHWGERRYTKAAGKAAEEIKKQELELQRDQINRDLSASWSKINILAEQLVVAKENLLLSEQNLEINTFSYQEGRLSIIDVLQAQMSWVQAFTSLINSNYGYKVAIADYTRITGSYELPAPAAQQ